MPSRIHASATIEPLRLPPRRAFERVRAMGYAFVQLSAAQPGLRPRELGASARRDLVATLRRLELLCSGLDLWIPPEHLVDAARVDRAVAAVRDAVRLAHDLGGGPVSLSLPDDASASECIDEIAAEAMRFGVPIADYASKRSQRDGIGLGIDPPALIGRGEDPADHVLSAGPDLIAARLADLTMSGMRAPVGGRDGRLDHDAYLATLSAGGHERPVIVDARQWNDPEGGLLNSASIFAQHALQRRI